ncbi:GPI-GlcNAc transferase complex, PIG-H component-domain-containing protein [Hypoxylon trugodes]|uniref:GPI-GlcNAc transferase complex, PIG-H component-domain-containing protein n=1 Tax=Hypoxylon trugodes TaxID=326681 RepID=UPI0021927E04|nr:GPI-GlcNAc transferase complex, PIG-H component-domain-containing protein [Hypoxylon trugodes]KAI1388938.1 GPI-GlcNAc transferase complex, PIG-H component-domain-containing protein [Hypoxylon trugodes]
MLTTIPYLRIRRPSPTTAEFVVSTLPPPTIALRLALTAVYFVRLVLGLAVLLLLYSAWAQSPYSPASATTNPLDPSQAPTSPAYADTTPSDTIAPNAAASNCVTNDSPLFSLAGLQHTLQIVLCSRVGTLSTSLAASIPPWVLIPTSLATLYLLSLRVGIEERLLVLRGLGIQTSSSGATIFSSLKTRFIPTDKIQDVLINEAFRGFEVRHYLVVVVEGEEHVVVVFPRLLPRPRIVEKVWRGVRACLHEHDGELKRDGKS